MKKNAIPLILFGGLGLLLLGGKKKSGSSQPKQEDPLKDLPPPDDDVQRGGSEEEPQEPGVNQARLGLAQNAAVNHLAGPAYQDFLGGYPPPDLVSYEFSEILPTVEGYTGVWSLALVAEPYATGLGDSVSVDGPTLDIRVDVAEGEVGGFRVIPESVSIAERMTA